MKLVNPIEIWHGITLWLVLAAAVVMAVQGYDATGTASVIAASGLAVRLSALTLSDRIGRG